MTRHLITGLSAVSLSLSLSACGDVEKDHDHDHEQELITTVELVVVDGQGGETTYRWADPENDGSPTIDPIVLADSGNYMVSVRFLDELQEPAEDITEEISDEDDEHQVFFTGTAVGGIVQSVYADEDADGNPVGLEVDWTALTVGSGELTVTLRHLPPEDGTPVKTGDLAETVASDGFSAIPGDNDAQVTFPLDVE